MPVPIESTDAEAPQTGLPPITLNFGGQTADNTQKPVNSTLWNMMTMVPRIGLPMLRSSGGPQGAAAGAIGEILGQMLEQKQYNPFEAQINWPRVAAEAGISAIPGGSLVEGGAKLLSKQAIKSGLKGAAAATGSMEARRFGEGTSTSDFLKPETYVEGAKRMLPQNAADAKSMVWEPLAGYATGSAVSRLLGARAARAASGGGPGGAAPPFKAGTEPGAFWPATLEGSIAQRMMDPQALAQEAERLLSLGDKQGARKLLDLAAQHDVGDKALYKWLKKLNDEAVAEDTINNAKQGLEKQPPSIAQTVGHEVPGGNIRMTERWAPPEEATDDAADVLDGGNPGGGSRQEPPAPEPRPVTGAPPLSTAGRGEVAVSFGRDETSPITVADVSAQAAPPVAIPSPTPKAQPPYAGVSDEALAEMDALARGDVEAANAASNARRARATQDPTGLRIEELAAKKQAGTLTRGEARELEALVIDWQQKQGVAAPDVPRQVGPRKGRTRTTSVPETPGPAKGAAAPAADEMARLDELNAKDNAGTLTPDEAAEFEERLLAWQAKQQAGSGRAPRAVEVEENPTAPSEQPAQPQRGGQERTRPLNQMEEAFAAAGIPRAGVPEVSVGVPTPPVPTPTKVPDAVRQVVAGLPATGNSQLDGWMNSLKQLVTKAEQQGLDDTEVQRMAALAQAVRQHPELPAEVAQKWQQQGRSVGRTGRPISAEAPPVLAVPQAAAAAVPAAAPQLPDIPEGSILARFFRPKEDIAAINKMRDEQAIVDPVLAKRLDDVNAMYSIEKDPVKKRGLGAQLSELKRQLQAVKLGSVAPTPLAPAAAGANRLGEDVRAAVRLKLGDGADEIIADLERDLAIPSKRAETMETVNNLIGKETRERAPAPTETPQGVQAPVPRQETPRESSVSRDLIRRMEDPNLSEAERAAAMQEFMRIQDRVAKSKGRPRKTEIGVDQTPTPKSEAPESGGLRNTLRNFGRDTSGEIDPRTAMRLGTGAAGAVVGYNQNEEDPIGGALTGGMLGLAAGSMLPKVVSKATSLPEAGRLISKDIGKKAANYYSAGLLSDPLNLTYNSFAGPWGSHLMGGLEEMMKGNPQGKNIVMDAMNFPAWAKGWRDSLDEAQKIISQAERADWSEQAVETGLDKLARKPGELMTRGDVWVRNSLMRRGISPERAREITLTNTPGEKFPLFKNIDNWGKSKTVDGRTSTAAHILMPFKRVIANIGESGLERMPFGMNYLVNKLLPAAQQATPEELKSRSVLGTGVFLAAATIGTVVPDEAAKVAKLNNLISNMGGQYSAIANAGFLVGQAMRGDKPLSTAITNSVTSGIPVPSTEIVRQAVNLGKNAANGELPSLTNIPFVPKIVPAALNAAGAVAQLSPYGQQPQQQQEFKFELPANFRTAP